MAFVFMLQYGMVNSSNVRFGLHLVRKKEVSHLVSLDANTDVTSNGPVTVIDMDQSALEASCLVEKHTALRLLQELPTRSSAAK